MPRPPRLHAPGLIWHVMARGVQGQPIYEDEADYRVFLVTLDEVKSALGFELFAYCLMTNHFHLLVRVHEKSISAVLQSLLLRFSKYSNRRRSGTGHVFQDRFKSVLCRNDAQFLHAIRYIHLNPVEAGTAAAPEDWAWSGHHELAGLRDVRFLSLDLPRDLLLQAEAGSFCDAYRRFMGAAAQRYEFERAFRSKFDVPAAGRPEFSAIAQQIASETGVVLETMREPTRSPRVAQARRRFVLTAVAQGYSTREVAAFLAKSKSAIDKLAAFPKKA